MTPEKNNRGTKPPTAADLRSQAEGKLETHARGKSASPMTALDSQRLVHELEVHQIELEMQNEELLQSRAEAEAVYRQYIDLYDFAPVGYFTLARDGVIQRMNLKGARLLGEERKNLLKRRFGLFVSTASRQVFNAFLEKIFTSRVNEICEVQFENAGQKVWWGRLEGISPDGMKCRVAAIDITARIQAEEALRLLNASLEQRVEERTLALRDAQEQLVRQERLAVLGQLASGVSHELRNPLAVILNAIYYLKLIQPDANQDVKEYLEILGKETHNAEKIVSDLLDFARVQVVDREPVAVSELVHSVLERYPAPPTVTVTLDLPADLPALYVDPRHAEQVLGNLVTNACQAMPEGGALTISALCRANEVALAVRDTGTGITPEDMEKLFTPLFTTKAKGIGMGLAVCKKLAEANGGRIEVQSVTGHGATFTLYLPISR